MKTMIAVLMSALLLTANITFAATIVHHDYESGTFPVADVSGNGHVGNNHGANFSTDAAAGSHAMQFGSGSPTYYDIDSLTNYDFGDYLEVEFEVKHHGGNYRAVINNGYHINSTIDIRFGSEDNGTRLYMLIGTTNGFSDASGTNVYINVPVNQWHHVKMRYDGTSIEGYLDGSLVASKPFTGSILPYSNPIRVGAGMGKNYHTENFIGQIDNLIIRDDAVEPIPAPVAALAAVVLMTFCCRKEHVA